MQLIKSGLEVVFGGQGVHEVEPEEFEKVFAGHCVHDLVPKLALNVPGLQARHVVAADNEKWPGAHWVQDVAPTAELNVPATQERQDDWSTLVNVATGH